MVLENIRMAEHSELVAEIASVEKMNTPDRLKHAKKRRNQQLKRWANYERQLDKESSKKRKQSSNQRRTRRQRVKFIHNIMLLEAAARNDVEEVRKLLMAGVSPNVTNEDGLTALHQCCIDDSEEMLKLLLEFGADVNSKDSEQWTPLHAAATCGHVHLCRLLIDKGAELLAVNADGNMPYDICEDEVALDYIETEMAKRGVTQEEIDDKRVETEKQMLDDLKRWAAEGRDIDRDYKDINGATPVHIAAANGYIDVLEFLLDHHASLNIRDYDSWLPIHAAACWLQPEVLEILVKNGADLDAKTRNGETAFGPLSRPPISASFSKKRTRKVRRRPFREAGSGHTKEHDLAEDPDVKQKILDLKDELESHRASKSKDHIKGQRRSVNPRSRLSSTGSHYSSNGSINEKPSSHAHSASIRRTSMRGEKRPLFKKEAHEEALHFGVISRDDDEEDDEDKNHLPATNIDDVTISIVEDETDKYSPKPPKKTQEPAKDRSPREPVPGHRDREKVTPDKPPDHKRAQENSSRDSAHKSGDISRGDHSQRNRNDNHLPPVKEVGNNSAKVVSPISDKNERNDSHTQRGSHVANKPHEPRPDSHPANKPWESRPDTRDVRERSLSPPDPPHLKALNPVGRTGSFIKNRDSPRRQSREIKDLDPAEIGHSGQPRYPSGTPPGTLSDLKKQRSENHKMGNGLDAQVQNLFLHSLSGAGNKYSSGSSSSSHPPQTHKRESTQNGRNVKNNNNNTSGPSRPPTFISDSGPLRKFSAPTSHPVIGEDDKFKNNCCVIL